MKFFKLNYLIYIGLLIVLVVNNFPQVNCINKGFISQNGQWGVASNWADSIIPTNLDVVYIQNSNNQKCFSSNGKITANRTIVGGNNLSGIIFQIDNYGFLFDRLSIQVGGRVYLGIKGDPATLGTSYDADVEIIFVYGELDIQGTFKKSSSAKNKNTTIQLYQDSVFIVDSSVFETYIVNAIQQSTVSFQTGTKSTMYGLIANDGTFVGVGNSTILIKNNPFSKTTFFNSSAQLSVKNSTFECHDVSNLAGGSEFFFSKNSYVSFIDDSADLFNEIGLYVDNSSIFIQEKTYFYSEKFIGNFDSYIQFENGSVGFINNDYYLNGKSILVVKSSTLTLNHTLLAGDDSWVYVLENSTVNIKNNVLIEKTGLISGFRSKFEITGKNSTDNLIFQLEDQGQLYFYDYSTVILESNLQAAGNSVVAFNHTYTNFNSKATFFNTSTLIGRNFSTIVLDDNLIMVDNSSMYLEFSDITINGSIVFNDNAFLTMRQSSCKVKGFFSDYTSPIKEFYLAIINSQFSVDGYLFSSGNILISNSTLECNNEFKIVGGLRTVNNSHIIVSNGNFSVDGRIRINDTTIELKNGILEFSESSNSILSNSTIVLDRGDMKIKVGSTLELLNTKLINKNANMNINGNIYINTNSSMTNGANFKLNSNILPINSSGSEEFNNEGFFEITKGANESIIMVPVRNSGTINFGRETTIISFTSTNGTILINPNATLHSNNSVVISNSSVQGSGVINSSISSNGGSSYGNGNITSLDINGSLESTHDEFVFTMDSKNSTIINIGNNATITNATLIIRVSNDIVNSTQNTTLLTSTNLNVSFGKIVFQSYDPETGIQKQLDDCAHKIQSDKSTLGVLLNANSKQCVVVSTSSGTGGTGGSGGSGGSSGTGGTGSGGSSGQTVVVVEEEKNSSLSAGAIAGIIVGVVCVAGIVGIIIHFKNKLPSAQRLTYKLKNLGDKP
ncbi:hypothetical protein RB653_005558 [Dictyostelium firmibasis]|uniref:Transmembrane protein n=1 Tax=Dictyostelium firmibasis TaxID=79012 RepID=A0AAN7U861_9MYCE